jgi:hypothetical protein
VSSACEVTSFGGLQVKLGKEMKLLPEQSLLCDLRDKPVLYHVGERVKDIKDNEVIIENFGIIVSKGGNTRGAICRSNGGWLRFLPLIQLEKV